MVCPNCGAKYEVDASLIPPSGRDVQCSNCGETWFEEFEQAAAAPEPTAAVSPKRTTVAAQTVAEPVADVAETPADEPPVAQAAPPEAATTEPAAPVEPEVAVAPPDVLPPEDADDEEDEPPLDPAKEIEFPTPPHIADSVREMLKTESSRETAARAEEEPGSDNWGKRRQSPLREKMDQARISRGAMPEDTAMATAVSGLAPAQRMQPPPVSPRRGQLPDVEEINSSLQTAQDQYAMGLAEDGTAPVRGRSGFGKGFFFVIFLAVVAVIAYALADLIAQQIPQLKAPLDAYVDWVDALRAWLDEQVRSFMAPSGTNPN